MIALAAAAAASALAFGDADGALRLPEAVAAGPDGTVLVGDHFGGRIQRFRDGRPAGPPIGLHGRACGRLGAVGGVARAADGRVFVLDTDRQRVQVFAADGRSLRCFGGRGTAPGRLRTSSGGYAASTANGGIAVGGDHVYVADTGNDRVQRFSLEGRSPKVIGRGRLATPQGLAVRGGRLLVADDGHHRVAEFTTGGRFMRGSRVRLRFPYDVAVAPNGHAYVADNNAHRIVELDRRLRHVRAWGRFGSGRGELQYPRAVAVAPDGHVLVADPGNSRVTEFTAHGRFVRTLGSDGRAHGRVTAPADVAVNGFGEIAVADGNARLSWFDLGGRALGAWAQGRSFQQSTAIVNSPRAVAFAGDARLRAVDAGQLREYGAGVATVLVGGTDRGDAGGFLPVAADVDGAGTTWVLGGRGRFVAVAPGGRAGPAAGDEPGRDRSRTAVAALGDGTVAVTEGPIPDRPRPADGVVLRYDAAGRRLATWALPRPPGGEASAPAGVTADGEGGAWVSDAANDRLVHLSSSGVVVETLGEAGAAPGQFAEPRGLALDCAGGLVVADTGNNRVQRIPGVAAARGCGTAATPTAADGPPAPLGLRVTTERRAERPAAELAVLLARCRRTCTLTARASVSTVSRAGARTLPLEVRRSGTRLTVRAGATTLRAIRSAVRAGALVTAGASVSARGADGVVDDAQVTLALRR